MIKKKTIILGSLVVAIPLTAAILASLIRKRKLKSPEASNSSFIQMDLKRGSLNILTGTSTDRQQEEESFAQRKNNQDGSEHIEIATKTKATPVATADAFITSTDITNEDREDITPPVALVVMPSSLEPSSSSSGIEKEMISSSQIPMAEEISVSDETKKAGESLKDLIIEAFKDAKGSAKETGKRLRQQTVDDAATSDSGDIQTLKDYSNTLVRIFETMMLEIRKEPYDRQVKLLERYRELLHTQSKIVNARGRMARKLKPGS